MITSYETRGQKKIMAVKNLKYKSLFIEKVSSDLLSDNTKAI